MKYLSTIFILTAVPYTAALAGPYYCNTPFFIRGGGIMWPITIVLSGFLIYLVYKSITGPRRDKIDEPSDVMSILNRRLVKGEISEDEYDRLKNRISG